MKSFLISKCIFTFLLDFLRLFSDYLSVVKVGAGRLASFTRLASV